LEIIQGEIFSNLTNYENKIFSNQSKYEMDFHEIDNENNNYEFNGNEIEMDMENLGENYSEKLSENDMDL